MSQLVLGVFWAAFVVGIWIPAATLVAKALSWIVRSRGNSEASSMHGLLAVVLPTGLPVIWFASDTFHQSEAYFAAPTTTEFCYDLVIAVALLGAAAVTTAYPLIRKELGRSGSVDDETTRRLRAICEGSEALVAWAPRVVGLRGGEHDAATRGFISPRIEIDEHFARRLDDLSLAAVLLHEASHAASRDPLRNLIGRVCLRLNPIGARFVADQWNRWLLGRELECDAAALDARADALSLAGAIVTAARCSRCTLAAPLTGPHGAIRLRVQRILEPLQRVRSSRVGILISALSISAGLIVPHLLTSSPLQQIHFLALHPFLNALGG